MRTVGWMVVAFGLATAACGGDGGEMCVPADPVTYDSHCEQEQIDAEVLCEAIPPCTTITCRKAEAECRIATWAKAAECAECAGCWNAARQHACRLDCETAYSACLSNGGGTCGDVRAECVIPCGTWEFTVCAQQFP